MDTPHAATSAGVGPRRLVVGASVFHYVSGCNTFAVQNVEGSPSDALNYDFTEKIGAGYGQFKFTAGNLLAIGGVRYEHTDQQWVTGAPVNSVIGANGSVNYFDVLPSLNLKYSLGDKQDLRLSYYSAIS